VAISDVKVKATGAKSAVAFATLIEVLAAKTLFTTGARRSGW
jgi:hypothetical protein